MTTECRSYQQLYWCLTALLICSVSTAQDLEPVLVSYLQDDAPKNVGPDASLKPLSQISLSIADRESVPEDRYSELAAAAESEVVVRHPMTYSWVAPGLSHNPLYTEDVALERYGWSYRPVVQPFVSGVHFLADVALLPYQAGLDCPSDVQCNLGYRRPGNCAPQVKKHLPWSWKGAALQGGAVVGVSALFP